MSRRKTDEEVKSEREARRAARRKAQQNREFEPITAPKGTQRKRWS